MAKKTYIGAKLLTNLIPDGDFETTSWNGGEQDSAHVKYGRYARKMTGSTGEFETTVSSTATIQLTPAHKYYVCIEAYQTIVSGSVDIYWPIAEPAMLSGQALEKANQWCRISTVVDRGAFSAGKHEIRFDYNNQNQTGTMWFDGAMLIDLTAEFGSGKEPAKEWCDAHIQFTAGGQVCCFDTANSVARNVKSMFIGVDGKARKVKKAYVGVGGKARLFYTSTLPPAIVDLWKADTSTSIDCVTHTNGYWVVGGNRHVDDNYFAFIAYAVSPAGPWTTKDIWEGTRGCYINCIAYANGNWVAGGYTPSRNSGIAYATSLDGPWTTKVIGTSSSSEINGIAYAEGYWVIGGSRADGYASVAYATSLEGTWDWIDLWKNSDYVNKLNCITFANGNWVVGGTQTYSSRVCYARIAYAKSPNGAWTEQDIWESSYSGSANARISGIIYADGYWAVCGEYYKTNSQYGMSIAYSSSLDGTWTTKDIWTGNSSNEVNCIAYADGNWVVGGRYASIYARLAWADSLGGNWTAKDLWSTDSSNYIGINGVAYSDGYWIAGGECLDPNSHYYCARIAYAADLSDFDQI